MQRLEDHLRKYKAIYTVIFGIIFLFILSTNLGRIENNTRSLEYDNSKLEKALIDINDNLDEIRKNILIASFNGNLSLFNQND